MSELIIKNNGRLKGSVKINGSKNSSLPIMAACILTKGKNTLFNVPKLSDINVMYSLLESLGARIDVDKNEVGIDCENISDYKTPYELVGKLRGSFLLAGALLSRTGKARIALPGGCPIGTRPVDLHLKGFAKLGADISKGHGYVELESEKLHGAKIYLDFPSVGATENIIIASVLAEGETIIENAAAEPEITDLCDFLVKQGAKITGAGSDTIKICGVEELKEIKHEIIPDRIEAGTFMTAFAITKGTGIIENVNCSHLKPITAKLGEMGALIKETDENKIEIRCDKILKNLDIKTMPYPGFPTDMQAPFSSLQSIADGTGMIVETVFENRFLHIAELNRMGANIKIDGRTSFIEGVKQLSGTNVSAFDLRGGAALVLAGLAAKGETRVSGVEHIERGYERFVEKLNSIGADIERL